MDYLADLLKEKKQLSLFPNYFPHLDRLLDEEIARMRFSVFRYDLYADSLKLPEPKGEMVQLQEKVYIPKKDHPDYNFVGRILGPRGMTAKQLEQETGCKIMIRGKGSMRDRVKEELNRGKPNYEHLDDDLHVLIQCEDTKERATIKIANAANQIKKLLVPPAAQGIDELKRKQLMELAIINGTYRPNQTKNRLLPAISSLFASPMPAPGTGNAGNGGSGGIPSSPLSSLFSTPLSSPSITENNTNLSNTVNNKNPLSPLGLPSPMILHGINGGPTSPLSNQRYFEEDLARVCSSIQHTCGIHNDVDNHHLDSSTLQLPDPVSEMAEKIGVSDFKKKEGLPFYFDFVMRNALA